MPTYAYRREDGTTFEIRQRITEDALDECPETGQSVERIITGSPGVLLDSDNSTDRSTDRGSEANNASCCGPMCGL
jgi:putative FmdB family regulatory protein